MSILSQLLHKKITFSQAAVQAEQWGVQITRGLTGDPMVVAAVGEIVSGLKQDASNAISIADSLAGPIIAGAADGLEALADTAFKAYFGPFAPVASKATHDSVDRIAAALKAVIDAKAAETKAAMAPSQPAVGAGS